MIRQYLRNTVAYRTGMKVISKPEFHIVKDTTPTIHAYSSKYEFK